MKNKFLYLIFVLLGSSAAYGACPATAEGFGETGAKQLVQHAKVHKYKGITDFSSKISTPPKSGSGVELATSKFKAGSEDIFQVQVNYKRSQVLNGVFRCDSTSGEMKLLNVSWVSPTQSGTGSGE